MNRPSLRRRFRRIDLAPEDQRFFRILAALSLATWSLIVWSWTFPPSAPPRRAEAVAVAKLLLKPPAPREEQKPEPKPEPLPPRKEAEKAVPAPPRAPKPAPKVVARAPKAPVEAPKRSVATMGLLSMLSSSAPRAESASQRIGETLRHVDFHQAHDLTEDVGSLTGSVGARGKASVSDVVAGLPHGTGTNVVLEGKVVSPISGPGGPRVSGAGGGVSGRTLAEIRDVVAQYIAGLKYLYDRELKQRPSLHGKVTVEFVVTPDGSVDDVRLVSSGLGYPSLENAILSRIRGWRFPSKPGDATRVTFPFDFVAPSA